MPIRGVEHLRANGLTGTAAAQPCRACADLSSLSSGGLSRRPVPGGRTMSGLGVRVWFWLVLLLAGPPVLAAIPAGAEIWSGRAACDELDRVRVAESGAWAPLTLDTAPVRGPIWLRFPLPPAWPPQMLAVPVESARYLHVYRPGVEAVEYRSVYLPTAPYDGTAHWHSIALQAPAPGMVHVCLRAPRIFPASVRVLPQAEQIERELNLRTVVVGSFATMLAMSVFALIFWIALRDRLYLYYCAHVLTFIAWTGFNLQIFARFLTDLPGAPMPLLVLGVLALSLSAMLIIGFARSFLDLPRWSPAVARLLRILMWALLVAGIFSAVATIRNQWFFLLIQIQNLLIGISGVLLIAISLRLAWQGHRYARYFCVGWMPFLILVFLAVWLSLIESEWALAARVALLPAAAFETFLLSVGLADRTLALKRERDAAVRAAERDALTGVLNRRGFEARLQAQQAGGQGGALLLCDLDHFKRINDRYGHPAGDRCLLAFVERTLRVLPAGDELGRYGGEEFVVLLRGVDVSVAWAIAERLRRELADTPVVVGEEVIPVTVSIGLTMLDASTLPDSVGLIARADAALYRAKADGRNRVVDAADIGEPG